MKLELVGRWRDKDAVFLIKKEEDMKTLKVVEKIHNVLNHESKDRLKN